MIWHGLDGSAGAESDTLVTRSEMNSRAKEIEVRLEQTKKGYKLENGSKQSLSAFMNLGDC